MGSGWISRFPLPVFLSSAGGPGGAVGLAGTIILSCCLRVAVEAERHINEIMLKNDILVEIPFVCGSKFRSHKYYISDLYLFSALFKMLPD